MLTPRNVVLAAVIAVLLSLALALLAFWQPPGGGLGTDTYGTSDHGFRGIFELLGELHVPVERATVPPNRLLDRDMTLALLEPSPEIASTEPTYLNDIGKWVRTGGTVVVSPSIRQPQPRGMGISVASRSVLSELGLEGVSVQLLGPEAPWRASSNPDKDRRSVREEAQRAARSELRLWRGEAALRTSIVHATAEGTLASVFPRGLILLLPDEERRAIDTEDEPSDASESETKATSSPPAKGDGQTPLHNGVQSAVSEGRIRAVLEPNGEPQTLAAVYKLGEGTVTVLADVRLAQNFLLGEGDNSVLLAHLLADARKPVVFDEFYHGLTVRANPLWLLSRFPYDILAASVLAATVLAGWRAYRFLGPPLSSRPASRRTLSEYIEAMARLLNRSENPAPFLLGEIRQGLLWRIRHDLGLPPGPDDADKIVRALERRDPALASKAREAVQAIDESLANPDQSARELAATLEKVSVCVPRHAV
jgi:Domain of unknown function (DUF4350)